MRITEAKRFKTTVLFLFLFFLRCLCFADSKQAGKAVPLITAQAEIEQESVNIGDKIKYIIRVQAKKYTDVEFPDFKEELSDFIIKDSGFRKKNFLGRKKFTKWYLLSSYKAGEYTIPGPVIKYKSKTADKWEEIEANEIKIEVKSLLEETGDTDIRGLKGPLNFFSRGALYAAAAAGILLLLLVLGVLFFSKKREKEKIILPRPPHEIAYEALGALQAKGYVQAGRIKQYYIELSFIVRRYLEDRFYLKAPEMTTEEFFVKAGNTVKLSFEHKELLKEFLQYCDLVKFAKHGPSENEINASFQSANKLIGQTRQDNVSVDGEREK